jgi:hypothetical protein
MPHLNAFAICERIIIDAKGIPSLINLFQRIDIQLQEEPLPKDAVAPGRWAVFSMWQLAPEEVGKEFVQFTKVSRPDQSIFVETMQSFKIESDIDLTVRTFLDLNGIPIGSEGRIWARTWLRGDEQNIHEISFYLRHLPKLESPDVTQPTQAASSEEDVN